MESICWTIKCTCWIMKCICSIIVYICLTIVWIRSIYVCDCVSSMYNELYVCMLHDSIYIYTEIFFRRTDSHKYLANAIELVPGRKLCALPVLPRAIGAIWMPPLVFEAILCSLVVHRGYPASRMARSLRQKGIILIDVILRDSLIYFLMSVTYICFPI